MRKHFKGTGGLFACLAVLLIFMWISGCGLFGIGSSSTTALTPKAQATLYMNTYKAENLDLQSLSKLTNATPAQVQLFKTKQEILSKFKPLLDAYNLIVDANGVPDATLESKLNDLVNQLVAAGGVK